MSDTITVPASLARCLREGLHSELGDAAEQIKDMTGRIGERSVETYEEILARRQETQLLLEDIGGETGDPPTPIEVDSAHRPIVLRVLEGRKQSYVERLKEIEGDDQREATEMIQALHAFIWGLKASERT